MLPSFGTLDSTNFLPWLRLVASYMALAAAAVTTQGNETTQQRATTGVVSPTDLRCEYRDDPLGIDVSSPRLSWVVSSPRRPRSRRPTAFWWQAIWRPSAATRVICGTPGAFTATRLLESLTAANYCTLTRRASGKFGSGTGKALPRPGARRPDGPWACSTRPNGKQPPGLAPTSHGKANCRSLLLTGRSGSGTRAIRAQANPKATVCL